MKKNYLYVLQENMFDCGVAALKTIFLQYGITIKTENIIKKKINQGITAYELINASKKLGINARGVKTNITDLKNNHLPCIAHIIKDKSYFHYIVILENNPKTKKITISDPEYGLEIITYDEFNRLSTGIFILFDHHEKKKINSNQFLNIINKYIKKNTKIIIKSLILSIFIITFSLLSNYYLKVVLNFSNNLNFVLKISILFFLIFFLKNLFEYLRNNIIIKLNYNLDKEINNDLINHILSLPYRYYSDKTTGELVNIINDTENFKELITKIFIILLVDIVLIISLLIFMSFYNLYYLIIFLILILISLFIAIQFQYIFNINYGKLKNNKIKFSSYLVESLNSYNTIKNLNIEKVIVEKNNQKYIECLNQQQKYNKSNSKYNFINSIITDTFYLIVIFISLIISIRNGENIFNVLLFSSMFYLLINFLNNITDSITMFKVYQVSINKVIEIFNEKIEIKGKKDSRNINSIKFENVSFSYNEEEIIKNLNFEIKNRDNIFIYGPSGCGKSTIMKLLLKYFEPKEGNIYFDNINMKHMESINIRSHISYVSQEETLFNDTIYNNLKIINSNDNEIKKVLKTCLINDFLKKNNIDSNFVLEENASNISGGERKKLLIARGLLKNSNIIIFDESFNELDLETERRILKNIKKNFKKVIIILISHRINNKDLFNKKYIFKNHSLIKEEQYERNKK